MGLISTVGLVLHPARDSAPAIETITGWAAARKVTVLGLEGEVTRITGEAAAVDARYLAERSDLVVSLGGDGTMLRAMRLVRGNHAPVLGVNVGRLGFLAEAARPGDPAGQRRARRRGGQASHRTCPLRRRRRPRPAARCREGGPAGPHHVLPARTAQAPAHGRSRGRLIPDAPAGPPPEPPAPRSPLPRAGQFLCPAWSGAPVHGYALRPAAHAVGGGRRAPAS